MKVDTQITEDHQAKLSVEVDAAKIEEMKHRAASKIARRVKIAGFRPGKAPYPVIVRQIGEPAIIEEALELLVEEIYPEVIKQAEINPYSSGKLENVANLDPVTLEFTIPLAAEVTLGDYKSIHKPYEPPPIHEQDIENVLQDLRERQAIVEPVDRPAQVGDVVTVLISAVRKDSETEQEKILIKERSTPVIIRPKQDPTEESNPEWPFSGFSHKLISLSATQSVDFSYTYPHKDEANALSGVEAEFHVSVENIKKRELPELNDEFAITIGEFSTLDGLRTTIKASLESQAMENYNDSYDEEILKEAVEQTTYKYPSQMMEDEIDHVIEDFSRRLEKQKLDLDLYLKSRKLDMDGLREEMKPVAENRMKRSLFLYELGKIENIQVNPEELESETVNTMNYLSRSLPQNEARKLSQKNIRDNLVGNILIDILSRKSMERFRNICSGRLEEEKQEEATQENEIVLDLQVTDKNPMVAPAEENES